jgi:hypothetical protein
MDDGQFAALRYKDWKLMFLEQRAVGSMSGGIPWCVAFREVHEHAL